MSKLHVDRAANRQAEHTATVPHLYPTLTMHCIALLPAFAVLASTLDANAQTSNFAAELRSVPEKQCVEPTYTATPLNQEIIGTVQLKYVLNADGEVTHVRAVGNGKYMLEQLTQRQLGGCAVPRLMLAGRAYAGEITISVPWTIPGVSDPVVIANRECMPAYPPDAARRRAEGTTLLDVEVSESGGIAGAKLVRSSGHDDLDQAALAAVKHCKARPGTSGGEPKQKRTSMSFVWRME